MPERANYASFVHSDPAYGNSGRSLQPRGSNSSGNPIRHVRGFGVGRTRIRVHVNSNLAVDIVEVGLPFGTSQEGDIRLCCNSWLCE